MSAKTFDHRDQISCYHNAGQALNPAENAAMYLY